MGRVWAQETGEGPRVVLVHGAMDRAGGMLRVRRELMDDHCVVRYDRRGYGRSLPLGPATSFDQQVDDLAGVVAGRPSVLVGHSYGGILCLTLAERRPDLVRAVMAYEAPRMWERSWPGMGAEVVNGRPALSGGEDIDPGDAAESMLRRLIGDAMWDRIPAGMQQERRAEGPALLADLRTLRAPSPPPYDAAALRVPVLAARGSQARPHHRRATDELARSAPLGELAVIEGAGHGAHLSHPAEFAALVRRTVERAEAEGGS
ncbi:MAG TPA: alpha/beta hydrolase [Acidimicrobiales bacterium]|nr:alpha/beta hydrolase [Acidimicrobiales bacterium]